MVLGLLDNAPMHPMHRKGRRPRVGSHSCRRRELNNPRSRRREQRTMPIPRPRSPAGRVVRHIIHHWSSGQFAETNARACMSGFVVAQPSGRENQARVGGSYRRGQ